MLSVEVEAALLLPAASVALAAAMRRDHRAGAGHAGHATL